MPNNSQNESWKKLIDDVLKVLARFALVLFDSYLKRNLWSHFIFNYFFVLMEPLM